MTQAKFNADEVLARVAEVLESRKPANGGDPAHSYVARLFVKGDDSILKKIGEEATETVMAAKDARAASLSGEAVAKVVYEVAQHGVARSPRRVARRCHRRTGPARRPVGPGRKGRARGRLLSAAR
jgi:phosphoribosyl-ATP pyrophosphohydrolase